MYLKCFQELFLIVLISAFEHKNSLRTIEAQIVQKLKIDVGRPKFTVSYKKNKRVIHQLYFLVIWVAKRSEVLNTAARVTQTFTDPQNFTSIEIFREVTQTFTNLDCGVSLAQTHPLHVFDR